MNPSKRTPSIVAAGADIEAGRRKIAWAWEHMPVLRRMAATSKQTAPGRAAHRD